jgi:hypothetical protein
MREFSVGMWFDLAAQAGALTRRYQDLAIELALLTERAYNPETERGLQLIRYDYRDAGAGDLLGADRLLADIDAFSADYITTVKSKKLPVKKVISIADAYPMAFNQLRRQGRCLFGTEFADFDREHPGLFLCKLRNVELVLVGITGATGIAGSLRNVGVSRFGREDGSLVSRTYPADVMRSRTTARAAMPCCSASTPTSCGRSSSTVSTRCGSSSCRREPIASTSAPYWTRSSFSTMTDTSALPWRRA